MRNRLVFVSLLLVTALSLGVVADAEANYRAVTTADETVATPVDASLTEDGVAVTVRVYNSMNKPLRVDFVRLVLVRPDGTDQVSIPFGERRSLPPGNATLTAGVPGRQIAGELSRGDRVRVRGYVAVAVFNGYEFEVPIREREVTV